MHKLIIHLIIPHLMRQNYSIYQSLPIPIIFDRLKYLKLFLNLNFKKIWKSFQILIFEKEKERLKNLSLYYNNFVYFYSSFILAITSRPPFVISPILHTISVSKGRNTSILEPNLMKPNSCPAFAVSPSLQ